MLDSSLRTTKADIQVIMVFNPPNKNHWIIKNSYNLVDSGIAGYFTAQLKNRTDTLSIFSTYKQNIKNINNKTIEIFENYKTSNSDYYYRMICGLVSEGKVGRIFKNWLPITEKEFFDLPYPMYMGLDIGYSSDPTALVIIKKYKNNLYVHELLYDLNLSNEDIAKRIIAFGYDKVLMYCELETGNKLTDHLRKLKVFAMPAKKGAGSINYGINELKANQIHYTETSKNLIFEYENYTWLLDARKMPTDTPSDKDNHLLDALRYVYYTCLVEGRIANDKVIEQTQTQRTSKIRKPKNTKNYVSDFR
jgi:phage terminase large subunit